MQDQSTSSTETVKWVENKYNEFLFRDLYIELPKRKVARINRKTRKIIRGATRYLKNVAIFFFLEYLIRQNRRKCYYQEIAEYILKQQKKYGKKGPGATIPTGSNLTKHVLDIKSKLFVYLHDELKIAHETLNNMIVANDGCQVTQEFYTESKTLVKNEDIES